MWREGKIPIVLDRENSVKPLWQQLHEQIQAYLNAGSMAAGDALPSERDLSEWLGVSRSTVRRCYAELRKNQLLHGRGRGGSVLTENRIRPILGRLKGFTQEMAEVGKKAASKVLLKRVEQNADIAAIFAVDADTPFLHLVRVRYADGIAMTREEAWLNLALAPQLQSWNGQGSSYEFLRLTCGIQFAYASQTVEAVNSSAADNLAFGFEKPQPCLLLKRKAYTGQQQLIEYVEGTFRGDLYTYQVELVV